MWSPSRYRLCRERRLKRESYELCCKARARHGLSPEQFRLISLESGSKWLFSWSITCSRIECCSQLYLEVLHTIVDKGFLIPKCDNCLVTYSNKVESSPHSELRCLTKDVKRTLKITRHRSKECGHGGGLPLSRRQARHQGHSCY
jgi:hypothetical protein